jgi:hypothetical protein
MSKDDTMTQSIDEFNFEDNENDIDNDSISTTSRLSSKADLSND